MLNHLKNEFNKTTTENGALAYKSTKSDVLDLFSQGGAMRQRNEADIKSLVSKSFGENQLLTLKAIFYLRDIEQGQGERRFFRLAMQHLALHHKESLRSNIELVPMFGRWDDLWVLLETDLKADVLDFVKRQLVADKQTDRPSLLAKWMPSENASSHVTKKYAKIMREHFGVKPKQYRKLLSELRAKLNLVETKLSEKRYGDIQYDKLPSRAGMVYRGAFFRNDEERYKGFLDSLSKGEVKVNAKTLYPNDIVGKILHRYVSPQDIKLFEGQWENLPNFIGDKTDNALVMADVSESMNGTPMEVSIALAMYIAERNKGIYHNHFLTFTDRPSFVEIKGSDIVEKVRNINARKGYSTNIQLALQKVLDVAIENNVSNDDVVKKLYIISDMQFDEYCIKGNSVDIFNKMRERFEEAGYDFPNIVFWNVRAVGNTPMTMNAQGVQLVSGYSPSILQQLLDSNGKTPYEFMLDVLETERYAKVTV
ncbi:DUF2828 domail-containing protein [Bacillus phage Izhevsk]|uniref:DUF2828 domail-containing protein n=1 Tax=Bacillus phage Izhevsk TaxID=2724322 RepID=A0A6H0X6H1_9CAUD|nr:DUF2828 domail-containing protein [Bacillus phage Izhevsk]QIW89909.1 DUF2828 domail-containing protein [Bacillus phage Izhevsk]